MEKVPYNAYFSLGDRYYLSYAYISVVIPLNADKLYD